ncbi:DUF2846 domain-containing protein [Desulfobulbus sp.]|uniref:DUF2846 domain-containing protein n=1 Tax=Desulfobulbus sp. TaxID=895 RepID=UPI00286EB504|nr:DUF2846 domain-containing protein [Desulfobulbus sp.]
MKFAGSALVAGVAMFVSGCATVPMTSKELSAQAKRFDAPPAGQSGMYIYRDSNIGGAIKKDIWIDGECLGESAPQVFFYKSVDGDKEHVISTESEFSPNQISIFTKSGTNYFVRQYIKIGVFVGGADLEVVPTEQGASAVQELSLAQSGNCSK